MSSSHYPTPPPPRQRRRFAPLSPSPIIQPSRQSTPPPILRGIIFDVDGTLCLPQNYMFTRMRTALNIPKSIDILDHINSLSDNPDLLTPTYEHGEETSPRSRATLTIKAIESDAMAKQTPQPGLQQLMTYLTSRNVRKALCTRNFPAPVQHLLEKFLAEEAEVEVEAEVEGVEEAGHRGGFGESRRKGFWPIITRETTGVKPKPSPEGLLFIARAWGVSFEKAVDNIVDPEVGRKGMEKETKFQSAGTEKDGDAIPPPSPANSLSTTSIGPTTPAPLSTSNPSSSTTTSKTLLPQPHPTLPLIMVGDSLDDLISGRLAGAATVLLVNPENEYLLRHEAYAPDVAITRLDELIAVLEDGLWL